MECSKQLPLLKVMGWNRNREKGEEAECEEKGALMSRGEKRL